MEEKQETQEELPLEDRILEEHPEWKEEHASPLFQFFFEEVVDRFFFEKAFLEAIETKVDYSARVGSMVEYMRSLEGKQEEHFVNYLYVLRKPEEEINTPMAVRMYGIQNTKVMLSAMVLWRNVKREPFAWDKMTHHPKADPEKLLKYALYCEEQVGDDIRLRDLAYLAGMVFDFFDLLVSELVSDRPDRIRKWIEHVFRHGILTGNIGKKIALLQKEFPYAKEYFPLCVMHDIGKVVMAFFRSEALKFDALLKQRPLPRGARFFAETVRNKGFHHAALGSMLVNMLEPFEPCSEAILFHHEPYLLRSRGKKELYTLSAMIALATNIANMYHIPRDANDPLLNHWFSPELHGFDLDVEALVKTIREAVEKEHR